MELKDARKILEGIGVDWDKFVYNYNDMWYESTLEEYFNGLLMLQWLSSAFCWSVTPEGEEYWSGLSEKLRAYVEDGTPTGRLD